MRDRSPHATGVPLLVSGNLTSPHRPSPFLDSQNQLESQLRQQRQRAEAEAAEASRLKSELEAAAAEKLSLQKRIGLLSRKNEDLGGENGEQLAAGGGGRGGRGGALPGSTQRALQICALLL